MDKDLMIRRLSEKLNERMSKEDGFLRFIQVILPLDMAEIKRGIGQIEAPKQGVGVQMIGV